MKVALVTGPSSGIGQAVASGLAEAGFHVVSAGRSPERIARIVDSIIARGGSAEPLLLNLASLDSVRTAAAVFVDSGRALHVLVNNAGIGMGRGQTDEGFEIHFGVNHLGHFLLTHHLGPAFAPGIRVITVASALHERVHGLDFAGLRRKTRSLTGIDEYAQSKLANILFARELARRKPALHSYAVHPGLVDTALIPGWSKLFLRGRLLMPEEGADTPIWCATSPDVAAESGLYYVRRQIREPSPVARDEILAGDLWRRSAHWCGLDPADSNDDSRIR